MGRVSSERFHARASTASPRIGRLTASWSTCSWGGASDVWIVPTDGGAPAQPLLAEPVNERDARMSRDGRWIAYVSDESGRPEVSVRTVSGPPKRLVVSGEGGDQPVWRPDCAELFFVDPQGQLRSVSVQWGRDGSPAFGLPATLNVPPIGRGHWGTPYDVSPDVSRIYFLRRNDDPPPREIHVVIGWRALLDQQASHRPRPCHPSSPRRLRAGA
jgi:hypothetical protein